MSFDARDLRRDRIDLMRAIKKLSLPINIRGVDAYSRLDTSVFYAKSALRELNVSVVPDVTWGPELCTYRQEADEFHPLECLMIDVPNALNGRVDDVAEAIRAWFEHA